MRVSRKSKPSSLLELNVEELHANFLALEKQTQAVRDEIADWNLKKAIPKSNPRRWQKKRLLVPPPTKSRSVRFVGAQPCNSNRLKHGLFARDHQLLKTLVRTHIRATQTMVAYAKQSLPRKAPLQREQSQNPLFCLL
jgi:hypothetical protein